MKYIIPLFLLSCFPFVLTAQEPNHLNVQDGLALEGYDPVSYFINVKPVKGSRSFQLREGNILYLFASAENRDRFVASRGEFKPQYGGWCAYAMGATGEKVNVDPETYKVVNGKLYLFYNRFFNNTLNKWNADEAALMKKADHNWNLTLSSKK